MGDEATIIGVAFAAIMLGQALVRVIERLIKDRLGSTKEQEGNEHPECVVKMVEIQKEIHTIATQILNDYKAVQADRINDLKAMAEDYKKDAARSRGAVTDLAAAVREAGLGVEVEEEGDDSTTT